MDLYNLYNHIKICLNISFVITSPSKYTTRFINTSSQIVINLPITEIHRHTIIFDTHSWWP